MFKGISGIKKDFKRLFKTSKGFEWTKSSLIRPSKMTLLPVLLNVRKGLKPIIEYLPNLSLLSTLSSKNDGRLLCLLIIFL